MRCMSPVAAHEFSHWHKGMAVFYSACRMIAVVAFVLLSISGANFVKAAPVSDYDCLPGNAVSNCHIAQSRAAIETYLSAEALDRCRRSRGDDARLISTAVVHEPQQIRFGAQGVCDQVSNPYRTTHMWTYSQYAMGCETGAVWSDILNQCVSPLPEFDPGKNNHCGTWVEQHNYLAGVCGCRYVS